MGLSSTAMQLLVAGLCKGELVGGDEEDDSMVCGRGASLWPLLLKRPKAKKKLLRGGFGLMEMKRLGKICLGLSV